MPASGTDIPVLASLAPLADTADAWISDIWGVIHNGLEAFPAAADACRRFRAQGGTVVLVTNAPRPAESVIRMLDRLGVPREAWDEVLTSGDVTRSMVDSYGDIPLFHLGPERMAGIFAGIEHRLARAEDAELVVCTGLFDDESETPAQYRPMLQALAARDIPLICANPDIMVERGKRLVPCAGALAEIYTELGGTVHYAGKPHPAIYEKAFAAITTFRGATPAKSRVLAIGDGLRTDMEGARRAGLRSVFIASALHVGEEQAMDQELLRKLFQGHSAPPVAAMHALAW